LISTLTLHARSPLRIQVVLFSVLCCISYIIFKQNEQFDDAWTVPAMAQRGGECRKVGQPCGGIQGFRCCQGLFCYPGDLPAGGVCRKQGY